MVRGQTKRAIHNLSQTKRTIHNLSQTKRAIHNLSQTKRAIHNLSQTKRAWRPDARGRLLVRGPVPGRAATGRRGIHARGRGHADLRALDGRCARRNETLLDAPSACRCGENLATGDRRRWNTCPANSSRRGYRMRKEAGTTRDRRGVGSFGLL
jgi:hypothetical protein